MQRQLRILTLAGSALIISLILISCGSIQQTEAPTSETTPRVQASITPNPTASNTPLPTLPDQELRSPAAQSSIDQIITSLEGLPIDQFFDESYKQLLLRDPEFLTELNLSEAFGLRDDQLNNLSPAYLEETQTLETAILNLLHAYNRQSLTPGQQLSYDVYEWILEDKVRGHEFAYHNYPLNHFINSYDFELHTLLTELHPLDDRQGVEDYISRLSQVDAQVEQLLEGLAIREQRGILPPEFILEMALSNLRDYLGMSSNNPESIEPRYVPAFYIFNESLESVPEFSLEERMAYRELALQQVEESFIPGYVKLIDYIDYLLPLSNSDAGVWKLPNGDEYYAYLLHKETSSELSADEIHELGLSEVERIKGEMRAAFTQLGYAEDESFGSSLNRVIRESGYYDISSDAGKAEYIAAIEAIIENAENRMDDLFDIGPEWGVEVAPGPMGG
jgi:uncharacterized protein (DUF885 family)